MLILICILPLMSAISSGLLGRWIGEKGSGILTTSLIGICSILSWISLYKVGVSNVNVYIPGWTWFEAGGLKLSFGWMFDSLTVVMLVLVTTVSSLVHLYSLSYMRGDPHRVRFMSYLSLFTFAMVILVTANNYLQMFIGWEGVGVCSYLLINFWYTRIEANKSAMQAMIMNRIGDIGLCVGMFILFCECRTLDYEVIFSLSPSLNYDIVFLGMSINVITVISICLLIGAVGKSAQIGLHTWLPEAMEGPTPVSALIHAATMVTAGIFVLIRSSPLIEYSGTALSIIVVVGSITAFFAASLGLVQNDLKKVIAYSTCSQLGYMLFGLGLSNYSGSLFHLFNHGFFKACLFLSAGAIIHGVRDEQDMRKLGSLIKSLPWTYSVMLIASLSLAGFPFLTGFYSKDGLLEFAFGAYTVDGTFSHWLGTISALFTAYYSFRLIYLTFINNNNGSQEIYKEVHESGWEINVPLAVLGLGSIFIGYLYRDMFIGLGTDFFGNSILTLSHHSEIYINSEFVSAIYKWVPVIWSLVGTFGALLVYHIWNRQIINLKMSSFGQSIYTFLSNKWNINQIYNNFIGKPLLKSGHNITYKGLDRGWIELLGPLGISRSILFLTRKVSLLQSGQIYNYAFIIFSFLTIIVFMIGNNNIIIEQMDIIGILLVFIGLL